MAFRRFLVVGFSHRHYLEPVLFAVREEQHFEHVGLGASFAGGRRFQQTLEAGRHTETHGDVLSLGHSIVSLLYIVLLYMFTSVLEREIVDVGAWIKYGVLMLIEY